MMDSEEARAALAAAAIARENLAAKMAQVPLWRHAAFGLVLALLGGGGTLSLGMQNAGTALAMGLLVVLVSYDRHRFGVFVNGYRRGGTLPLTLALVVAIAGLILVAHQSRTHDWPVWAKAAVTLGAFAVATGTSLLWQRLYLRDLRRGGL